MFEPSEVKIHKSKMILHKASVFGFACPWLLYMVIYYKLTSQETGPVLSNGKNLKLEN